MEETIEQILKQQINKAKLEQNEYQDDKREWDWKGKQTRMKEREQLEEKQKLD